MLVRGSGREPRSSRRGMIRDHDSNVHEDPQPEQSWITWLGLALAPFPDSALASSETVKGFPEQPPTHPHPSKRKLHCYIAELEVEVAEAGRAEFGAAAEKEEFLQLGGLAAEASLAATIED
jgi:hypothetical protein